MSRGRFMSWLLSWHTDWLYFIQVDKPLVVCHDESRGEGEHTQSSEQFSPVVVGGMAAYLQRLRNLVKVVASRSKLQYLQLARGRW